MTKVNTLKVVFFCNLPQVPDFEMTSVTYGDAVFTLVTASDVLNELRDFNDLMNFDSDEDDRDVLKLTTALSQIPKDTFICLNG